MSIGQNNIYAEQKMSLTPNRWDIVALIVVLGVIGAFIWSGRQMAAPYNIGQPLPISLDPRYLPSYSVRTVSRMLIGLFFSLLFTFIFGTWAAKSKQAEKFIIPLVDISQSVPVLAFQAISVVPFIMLFRGSLLGPECAAIFAIFTAQAWNMMLGFYQTVKTVPAELKEAADMFHLSAWQRFWRIEVPFSMPSLLWNTMMSMSASWFFVVATEAISVNNQTINLPGIGSYIALAIQQSNLQAVMYAIITMLIVIILYDQILFRPLVKWSEKFKAEEVESDNESFSLVVTILQRTRFIAYCGMIIGIISDLFVNSFTWLSKASSKRAVISKTVSKYVVWLWNTLLFGVCLATVFYLLQFILTAVNFHEIEHVFVLGLITAARVLILILLCSLIWVPVGVWIGMRPRAAQLAAPFVQFVAAFPANLLFPLVVILILRFHLNVQIWTTPLMILGAQWYILFNVIAGASALPKDLYHAANNFNVRGWLWWRRFVLPGIFPFYITGAITAAGGAWNASIVAEVVHWGHTTLRATGLGAYISEYTRLGDFHRIALGVGVMCLFVIALNRILWRPLYNLAEKRFGVL